MRNKLLIACKSLTSGGVETYLKTQCSVFTKLGWDITVFVCGDFNEDFFKDLMKVKVIKGEGVPTTSIEIINFYNQIFAIVKGSEARFIVHSYSEELTFPLLMLCSKWNLPLINSFHNTSYFLEFHGPFYDFLYYSLTFSNLSLSLVLSEEMEEFLQPYVRSGSCLLIRNPILRPDNLLKEKLDFDVRKILIVSRLDKDKILGIKEGISRVSNFFPKSVFLIAGEGDSKEELRQSLFDLEEENRLQFLGLITNSKYDLMTKSDLVIGMGRVALEAMSVGTPVLLIGYKDVKGLIDPVLFHEAAKSNFSGRNLPAVSNEDLKSQLSHLHQKEYVTDLQKLVKESYDAEVIWTKIEHIFQEINADFPHKDLFNALYKILKSYPSDRNILEDLDFIKNFEKLLSSLNLHDKRLQESFIFASNVYKDEKIVKLEQIDFYHKRDERLIKESLARVIKEKEYLNELVESYKKELEKIKLEFETKQREENSFLLNIIFLSIKRKIGKILMDFSKGKNEK